MPRRWHDGVVMKLKRALTEKQKRATCIAELIMEVEAKTLGVVAYDFNPKAWVKE
jgi:hypothetical protein